MALVPGLPVRLLAGGALLCPFRLLATVHPAIAITVRAAALMVTRMVTGLMLALMMLMMLALLLARLVAMALMLGRRRLGGGRESERECERGNNDSHDFAPLDFEFEFEIVRRIEEGADRIPGGGP